MRLRQVALVASDLRQAEHEICTTLGLELCYRDPGLAQFGLRHGLYPIGDRILEVVVPKAPGTTAGRYLKRRGGDGGYMVLVQTDDLARERERVTQAGFRIVHDGGYPLPEAQGAPPGESIHGIHLHPKDTGGAILSIDQANPPSSWAWAGHDWRYHSLAGTVSDLVGATIQAVDPVDVADRWGRALDRPAVRSGEALTISLDDASLRFVEATDGRGDGLAAMDLVATDRGRAGDVLRLCGVEVHFV